MNSLKYLIISCCVLSASSLTIPPTIKIAAAPAKVQTLGVPNILVSDVDNLPGFVSKDNPNDADLAAKQIIERRIGNFSAQIRGQIIQSKLFQVIDVNNHLALDYLSSESATLKPESNTTLQAAESATIKARTTSPNQKVDFMLIGQLSAISAGEEINAISGTTKSSAIYSIDIAVDYKLIRTKDRTIIASFTAAGHAGDAKIISTASAKPNHKIPVLVQQAGADLADEVISEINLQLGSGKRNLLNSESAPAITDVKTYSD